MIAKGFAYMKGCFLEKVTDSANGQIFKITKIVTFAHKENVLYPYVNFRRNQRKVSSWATLNILILFTMLKTIISVIYKYIMTQTLLILQNFELLIVIFLVLLSLFPHLHFVALTHKHIFGYFSISWCFAYTRQPPTRLIFTTYTHS